MGCLSVIIRRVGGAKASATRVGGIAVGATRIGGITAAATREGGINVAAQRVGGISVAVGPVCGETRIPLNAIWAADGLLITQEGGYLIGATA